MLQCLIHVSVYLFAGFLYFLAIPTGYAQSTDLTAYLTKCKNAIGAVPEALPDNPKSIDEGETSNGWENLKYFDSAPECLASAPEQKAKMFRWQKDDTYCLYLYRYDDDEKKTANGVLCYKKSNCTMCALDFKGPGPITLNDLTTPKDVSDNCNECHIHGTIAPKKTTLEVAKSEGWLEEINSVCAARQFGPKWITDGGLVWKSGSRHCTTPPKCVSCHANKWVGKVNQNYCSVFEISFLEPNGSMLGKTVPLSQSKLFMKCMGCTTDAAKTLSKCARTVK